MTGLLTARRSPRPVALFRIGVGLAALARLLDWTPGLSGLPEISAFTTAWTLAAAGLTLGIRARLCAWVLCALSAGLYVVDQNFWGHHAYVLTLLLMLALVDSDASLSVRWLRQGRVERDVIWWPMWLAQLQLSIAYVYTAAATINPAVLEGDLLARSLGLPPAPQWMAAPVVAAEFFIGGALWILSLRSWAFLLGFGLHALAPVLMGPDVGLIVFTLLVFAVYVLFVDARPRSRLVVWDDTCGFCRTWVTWLRRLDWLSVHRFEGSSRAGVLKHARITAEQAAEEITVRLDDRTVGGFEAIRVILETLPVSFLWARGLALWPINKIGAAAYRCVARRRHCPLPPR